MLDNFCPNDLSQAFCIGIDVLAFFPAASVICTAIGIKLSPSRIATLKAIPEFQDNQTIIERSKINRSIKQALTLVAGGLFFVFLAFYLAEGNPTGAIIAFSTIQGCALLCETLLLHWEYFRSGRNSKMLIACYILNFLASGGMSAILEIKNLIDIDCFVLLVSLQVTSLAALVFVAWRNVDFTKEALLTQEYFAESIHHKSTGLTYNGIDSSFDQNALLYGYGDLRNNKGKSMENKNDNEQGRYAPPAAGMNQNTNKRSVAQSEYEDTSNLQISRMTPCFTSDSLIKSNVIEDKPQFNYPFKDIKVIGYKAKENTMLFVVSYTSGKRVLKTDRSHHDFKYLSKLLSQELSDNNSQLSLPQLPKRIKETTLLDRKVLKDKMIKFNRFLFYIEFNQIDSKAVSEFLLPVKQKPSFAPHKDLMKESKASSVSSQGNGSEIIQEKNKVADIAVKDELFMKRISEFKGEEKQNKITSYPQEEEKRRSQSMFVPNQLKEFVVKQETNATTDSISTAITSSSKNGMFSFANKGIDLSGSQQGSKVEASRTSQTPVVCIPLTKEIEGTTYYELELHFEDKRAAHLSKRYNDFKEFHKQMREELKKENQTSLLPELPYEPSSKSNISLTEFRKAKLAGYLNYLWAIPEISSTSLFQTFMN